MSRNRPLDFAMLLRLRLTNIIRHVRFSMRVRYGRRLRAFLYISQSSLADDSGVSMAGSFVNL